MVRGADVEHARARRCCAPEVQPGAARGLVVWGILVRGTLVYVLARVAGGTVQLPACSLAGLVACALEGGQIACGRDVLRNLENELG